MGSEDKQKKDEAPQEASWEYKPVDDAAAVPDPHPDEPPEEPAAPKSKSIEWTASEFVAHEKGFGWYAMLTVAAAIVAAVIYLVTKDMFSVVVVLIMAVIFGVAGSHKPRVITYRIDGSGLTVGSKFYPYSAYKSFSMPQEGPFTTISLMPMKHLAFPVGAYLAPDSRDKVVDIVSNHLPLEHGELGAVDHLMRRLRF